MLVPGRYRNGYVMLLIGAAAAVALVGGGLTFGVLGGLIGHPALDPALLPVVVGAQKVALAASLALLALALSGLVVLIGSEWTHRRDAEELLRHLEAFRNGDWHPIAPPTSGWELSDIAAALNRLAEARRAGAPYGESDAEEVKTKFLEIISHQLRTPLTAVRWNLEALLRGELGPVNRRQEDMLRITNKNYQNILVMLSDWVEALEIERGLLQLNFEPVDLGELLEGLLVDIRAEAKLKELAVRASVARALPKVMGDKLKLRYVLLKLLHNAIAYTPEGGRVTIRLRSEGGRVHVEVRDTGVGIPQEEQPRIFKKFFRASNAALMQPNASGVGLFVTKVLVEAHAGAIGFESAEGKGTAFFFSLPVRQEPSKRIKSV